MAVNMHDRIREFSHTALRSLVWDPRTSIERLLISSQEASCHKDNAILRRATADNVTVAHLVGGMACHTYAFRSQTRARMCLGIQKHQSTLPRSRTYPLKCGTGCCGARLVDRSTGYLSVHAHNSIGQGGEPRKRHTSLRGMEGSSNAPHKASHGRRCRHSSSHVHNLCQCNDV